MVITQRLLNTSNDLDAAMETKSLLIVCLVYLSIQKFLLARNQVLEPLTRNAQVAVFTYYSLDESCIKNLTALSNMSNILNEIYLF